MTKEGFVMTDDSICLDAPERVGIGPLKVRIIACSGFTRQKWEYDRKVNLKYNNFLTIYDIVRYFFFRRKNFDISPTTSV